MEAKTPLLVIEDNDARSLAPLKAQGVESISGNAADPDVLAAANLPGARCLLVAMPDAFEGGGGRAGRKANPQLPIIARAHSEDEIAHLMKHGATRW